jgi:AraC family transcriptional regulator
MYTIEKGVLNNSSAYFHTPGNLAKSMFFYLTCAGHFYCDNNYRVEREDHDSYLLMYVKEGEGTIWYNGKSFTAKSNDVVLLNCHRPHKYETKGWETIWFHFDGNVSSEYFQLLYTKSGCIIPLGNSNIILKYLNRIMDTFKSCKILNEPLVSCYIQRMLTELILLSSDYKKDDKETSNPILSAINFIHENYKNKINLNDICRIACISPYHFSRIFKNETGYSPYEYIIMIRLNHAKNLLKTTSLRIKEIAVETGFNSESNFVTCFKGHMDITPSEFRAIPF